MVATTSQDLGGSEFSVETTQNSVVLRGMQAGQWYSLSVVSIGEMKLENQYVSDLGRVQTGKFCWV